MNALSLGDTLQAIDLALYAPAHNTLAIADLHLGFEEALHQDGALVPRGHLQRLLARLEGILTQLSIPAEHTLERIIINGDFSHHFSHLSARAWKEARLLLTRMSEISREVIVLQGNHDVKADSLAEAFPSVKIKAEYELGDLFFLHGHSEPKQISPAVQTIVIGHEHPAVGLRDPVTGRVELYKCFLVGPYGGRKLVVQPSFNPLVPGSDLTRERSISPLLNEAELGEFEIYPISDEGEIYRLGLLKHLWAVGSEARK